MQTVIENNGRKPYEKASITITEIEPVSVIANSGTGATVPPFVFEEEEENLARTLFLLDN